MFTGANKALEGKARKKAVGHMDKRLHSRVIFYKGSAKVYKKDNHSRRGLVLLVSQRKKLLKYLRRTNPDSYLNVTQELSIRRN